MHMYICMYVYLRDIIVFHTLDQKSQCQVILVSNLSKWIYSYLYTCVYVWRYEWAGWTEEVGRCSVNLWNGASTACAHGFVYLRILYTNTIHTCIHTQFQNDHRLRRSLYGVVGQSPTLISRTIEAIFIAVSLTWPFSWKDAIHRLAVIFIHTCTYIHVTL